MAEFVFSFVILLAIVAAMAIGVMRGRAPISGSCGGLNNFGIDGACEICGGDMSKCENTDEDVPMVAGAFYNATNNTSNNTTNNASYNARD